MIARYDFFRTKYGEELLIDLIRLEDLERYITATPIHRLSYYDITLISDGDGTFSIDGVEHPIGQGTILFSSPGQVRKWDTNKTPKGYVVIFEDEFLTTFFNDTSFVEQLGFFNSPGGMQLERDDYYHLVSVMEAIGKEVSVLTNDRHMLRALLYQLLAFLNRKVTSNNKKHLNRYVAGFVGLVNTSHHQQRSVNYYADHLNVTVGHLNSLVKEHLGVSAKQYILNRTILEAKRLLQYTSMGVDEIATALNYESTSYFVRIFRLQTGDTPLHFRNLSNP